MYFCDMFNLITDKVSMKKLFTLSILVAMAASSAVAGAPLVNGNSSQNPVAKDVRALSISNSRVADKKVGAEKRAAKVASRKEHNFPTGAYKSLGTGIMTDDMVASLFGYTPVTYSVEIQQSEENSSFYRVIAPYSENFAQAMTNINLVSLKDSQYDKDGVKYIDIDATDPNDVYFAKTYTGCDWGYGEMYIGIATSGTVTLKDGTFTATVGGLAVGDDDGALLANRNGKFRICLPGVDAKDYTLSLTYDSQCLTERKFTGTLTVGPDIAKVKYYVQPNFQEDEILSAIKEVAADGVDFTVRGAFEYEMSDVDKETLFVAGLDADGALVAYDWVSYYFIDDDNDNWESAGTAKYTDGFLTTFFNIDAAEMNVELQRNKQRPDFLRLVNPYKLHDYALKYLHTGHNHYIYINAEDPEIIYIEESPIGMDLGYGLVRASSATRYFLDAGFEIDDCKELEYGGVIEDNVLTFPDEALLTSMLGYEDGDWYSITEDGNTFKLALPDGFALNSGVRDVAVDAANAATPTYYNLQGVKIANPQPGTLVIRRQGATTTKLIAQ